MKQLAVLLFVCILAIGCDTRPLIVPKVQTENVTDTVMTFTEYVSAFNNERSVYFNEDSIEFYRHILQGDPNTVLSVDFEVNVGDTVPNGSVRIYNPLYDETFPVNSDIWVVIVPDFPLNYRLEFKNVPYAGRFDGGRFGSSAAPSFNVNGTLDDNWGIFAGF